MERTVLSGVISSTTESWAEYMYALRSYQAKLQQDAAFLQANVDATGQDANAAKKARTVIAAFIKSIPTKSEKAKSGVSTSFSFCLVNAHSSFSRIKSYFASFCLEI